MEKKDGYKYRVNANFNRKIQEQNHGGEKYESFNPGISISVGVDEDLTPKELSEQAEALYLTARWVTEKAIKQRKQELKGDRDEEDFLKDAKKAWRKMEKKAEEEGREFPKPFDPDKLEAPFSESNKNENE